MKKKESTSISEFNIEKSDVKNIKKTENTITRNLESGTTKVFEIKYIGNIKSDVDTEFDITLPNPFFFLKEGINNKILRSYKCKAYDSKIESLTENDLNASYTADKIVNLYKKNRDFISITIIPSGVNGRLRGQTKKIDISDLIFKKIDNSNGLPLILIDLGNITIN